MRRLITSVALAVAISTGVSALVADSPVADAASRGDRDAVKALLKTAAAVNAAQGDGMTALHWAAMNGDVDLAQMLIVAGANVKATTRLGSYTPLYLASQQGHGAIIQALIKAGGDVKAGTPNGTTPLMVAAASGELDAVKVLVDAGSDVNA
ncbi:MAG: ankyrin repeat domain-containing protein [Acidimicrobiia bacterium]